MPKFKDERTWKLYYSYFSSLIFCFWLPSLTPKSSANAGDSAILWLIDRREGMMSSRHETLENTHFYI
ncbi:hypothetical protein Y032_0877g2821 [Ancylostoma ceylanicum]|uniref:Uncharacterized protein n=1 Tax=Ancylostoma ceylanicum TaxID=53326 RepID=A0A016WAG2_9BILA|nr:hypothetical protein Y032_0877g2821 [Ancylostoma ceylanicum]